MLLTKPGHKMLIPAVLTLLHEDETFHPAAQKQLIELLLKQGADGFYVGGSTGCSPLLPMDLRKELIETVVECVNGRVPVIAYTGFVDVKQTVELSKFAARCGADAVSSVPPYYYGFSTNEIIEFYRAMAQESPLPVLVYYLQNLSGGMGVDTMVRILNLPNVCGMKYTAPNQFMITRLKHACPDKVIFSGCDEQIVNGLLNGADGAIGTTYNALCDLDRALVDAFEAGDLRRTEGLSKLANLLIEVINGNSAWLAAYCRLLHYFGIEAPTIRRPFEAMTDEALKATANKLYEYKKEEGAENCSLIAAIGREMA